MADIHAQAAEEMDYFDRLPSEIRLYLRDAKHRFPAKSVWDMYCVMSEADVIRALTRCRFSRSTSTK